MIIEAVLLVISLACAHLKSEQSCKIAARLPDQLVTLVIRSRGYFLLFLAVLAPSWIYDSLHIRSNYLNVLCVAYALNAYSSMFAVDELLACR